ncbi:hypothetical protein ACI2IP_07905 [Microbacterium sp. NPDC090218]
MSEPQQPPVPPSGHELPAAHLPAAPQYPASPQNFAAPQYPAAPPHTAAPQHPAAPQAHPAAPQAYPTASPAPQAYAPASPGFPGQVAPLAPARDSNPLGRTAFVIALATFAINLFGSLVRPFVYSGAGGFEFMLAFDNGIGILSFFVYVAALVLGLIAARRPGSKLLAGIAIGIAGTGAIGLALTGVTMGLLRYF